MNEKTYQPMICYRMDTDKQEIFNDQLTTISHNETRLQTGCLYNDKNYYILTVQDNGPGMGREILEHIFEPFFTTKEKDKGTGLGMAAVHGIIASNECAMVVHSRLGHGSKFDIYIPKAETEEETERPAAKALDEASIENATIMVVDDDELVHAMTTEALERMGYTIINCESAFEALEILKSSSEIFDLILSDYSMPKKNGVELAEEINRDYPEIPIVIWSGYKETTLEAAHRIPAVKTVLKKPMHVKDLAEELKKILSQYPIDRETDQQERA